MDPVQKGGFLTRLARESAGNTLAIAAASIFALMGVVGGAVDISRTYMAQSRLQQACDAGALAARKSIEDETLTDAEKAIGYRYFDFNFPAGSYGVELTSRTYSQPTNSAGTPQAIVNGTVIATVPTTIMRIFGKSTVDLTVRCSSKMDIANADVAMVLDVTLSMDEDMKIASGSSATETRLSALQKAVKAFYDSLGPGRAGGDLSQGRIRYAFVPYGITVNVGHLLAHDQMVDSWTYQSREVANVYGWTTTGYETSPGNYGDWTPASAPASFATDAQNSANYASSSFDTGTVGTGSGSYTYKKFDGSNASLARTLSNVSQANCPSQNTINSSLAAIGQASDTNETSADVAPIYPAMKRDKVYTNSRTTNGIAFRYRWFSASYFGSKACRLESAVGNDKTRWTQTQTKSSSRNITWTAYPSALVYGPRTIDVSGLKVSGGGWNSTLSVPGIKTSGSRTKHEDVKLSGSNDERTIYTYSGGTSDTVTWRGCVEERTMANTITGSTSVNSIPTGAFDLDTNLLASTSDDNTRWRPFLAGAVYDNNDSSPANSDDSDCPAPALRLQEIGNYNTTILSSDYPNLFEATSGAADSWYYPYTSSQWGTSSTPADERTKNSATLRNYINRIKMTSGTTHDVGFLWGMHLVSGEGMFASDNPDRFNGQIVSRNIVFMTDGEMNPGEERYVFGGFNKYDGRMGPASTNDSGMKVIENRRLRIACEAAKRQGITVWVVAITGSSTDDYDDLRACASAPGNFKTAATSTELINSFTTIAQSIGGLRISR
jgi:Flp pilus assembly protein TadG